MTTTETKTAPERIAAGERVLSLSECAERLGMKRPNVAKFLARRGVEPAFPKAQGYFWWEADIERVKAEREADAARIEADARRRQTARARARGEEPPRESAPEIPRFGRTQKALMLLMLRRPVEITDESRFALLRLGKRGFAERVDGERAYQLTAEGRRVAAELEES